MTPEGTTIVLSDDQRVAPIHAPTDDVGLVMIDRNATLITEALVSQVVDSARRASLDCEPVPLNLHGGIRDDYSRTPQRLSRGSDSSDISRAT